ncbi:importin subunit alpha-1-like [Daphnia pulicaria]|uniref:importin subunit alpha-1-like n=1 Tax=Daphnia pulicaria TaxID=35523 RepID=UPI001EEAFF58|nr:importin subunit alpha-1-like [Daphnia pulicaria]
MSESKCRIVEVNDDGLQRAIQNYLLRKRHNLGIDCELLNPLEEHNHMAADNMTIEDIVNGIHSRDENKEVTATHAACKILTRNELYPPIDILINADVVPKLVEFLSRVNNPGLQLNSTLALTNIVSGTSDQTKAVVSAGAVPGLLSLLDSPHPVVAEIAIRALGNIAIDRPEHRDNVIEHGFIGKLSALIKPETSAKFLRNVTWALLSLCCAVDNPLTVPAVRQLLPALAHLIKNNDEEILADACWVLADISKNSDERTQEVVDAGVVPRLVTLLNHNEEAVTEGALFAISTIYNEEYPDWNTAVINAVAIPRLMLLLDSPHEVVAVKAASTVVNIAYEPKFRDQLIEQGFVKKLLDLIKPNISVTLLRMVTSTLGSFSSFLVSPALMPTVRQLLPALAHLINNNDEEILSGACWALFWLTDDPNKRIQEVVDAGVIPRLVSLLEHNEWDVIKPALLTIRSIVTESDTNVDSVLAAGAWPLLAKLLVRPEIHIVQWAAEIASTIAVNHVTRPLVDVTRKGNLKCQKEAAWDITNITLGGNADALSYQFSAIASLCTLLKGKKTYIILEVLDCLALIFEVAEKIDELEKFSLHAKKCGGLDCIMALKSNENTEIRRKSLAILERYFSTHLSFEDKSARSTSGFWMIAPCN